MTLSLTSPAAPAWKSTTSSPVSRSLNCPDCQRALRPRAQGSPTAAAPADWPWPASRGPDRGGSHRFGTLAAVVLGCLRSYNPGKRTASRARASALGAASSWASS